VKDREKVEERRTGSKRTEIKQMTHRVFMLVLHVAVKERRLEDKPSFEESKGIDITRIAEWRREI